MTATTAVAARTSSRRMYVDAGALAGASLMTAGVGLVFWVVAARLLPPDVLGVQSAVLSLITAAAAVASTGAGNALVSLLPAAGTQRRDRVTQAYRLTVLAAVGAGVIAAVLALRVAPDTSPLGLAAVVLAVVVWSLFNLQDNALTGLGKAVWLPAENLAAGVARLALLPVLVAAGLDAVVTSSVLPAAVAVVVVGVWLVPRRLATALPAHADGALGASAAALRSFALRDGVASSLSLGVYLGLPFVVTVVAGPAAGALFTIALLATQSLDLVTGGLATSLTTHTSARPETVDATALSVWRRAILLALAGTAALALAFPVLLRLMGPDYVGVGGEVVVLLLAAGVLARTVFVVWSARQRALRRTSSLMVVNAIQAVIVLTGVIGLGSRYGAIGAAAGLALGQLVIAAALVVALMSRRRKAL